GGGENQRRQVMSTVTSPIERCIQGGRVLDDGRGYVEDGREDEGRVYRGAANDDLLLCHVAYHRIHSRADREGDAIHASLHRLDYGRGANSWQGRINRGHAPGDQSLSG